MPRPINSKRQQRANYLAQIAGFKNDYQYRKYRKKFGPKSNVPERLKIGFGKTRKKRIRGEALARQTREHKEAFTDNLSPVQTLIHKYNYYVVETEQFSPTRFILQYAKSIREISHMRLKGKDARDWKKFAKEIMATTIEHEEDDDDDDE